MPPATRRYFLRSKPTSKANCTGKIAKADAQTSTKEPVKKKAKLPESTILDDEKPDRGKEDAVQIALLLDEIAIASGAAKHRSMQEEKDRRRATERSEAAAEKAQRQDSARISILLINETIVKAERQIEADAAQAQRDAAAKRSAQQCEVRRFRDAVTLTRMLFEDSIRAGLEARISDHHAAEAAKEAKIDAACMAALLEYESNNPVQIPWRNLKNDNGDFVISKFRRRYDPVPQSFLHLLPGELRNQIYKRADELSDGWHKLEIVTEPSLAQAIPDLATEIYTWMFMRHDFEMDVFSKFKAAHSLYWPAHPYVAHGAWKYGVVILEDDHWVLKVDPRAVCFRKVCLTILEADCRDVCKIYLNGKPKEYNFGKSCAVMHVHTHLHNATRQRYSLSKEEAKAHATAARARPNFRGLLLHDLNAVASAFRHPDKKTRDALQALNVVARQS